jgi:hypothetical protein
LPYDPEISPKLLGLDPEAPAPDWDALQEASHSPALRLVRRDTDPFAQGAWLEWRALASTVLLPARAWVDQSQGGGDD